MSAISATRTPAAPTALRLTGGRVTSGFRNAVFDAAARAGVSVNELILRSAAVELARHGAEFPGVFAPGDLHMNEAA